MKKEFRSVSLSDMKEIASFLATLIDLHSVFAFHGALGAGKTTLIGDMVRILVGEEMEVTSPTFALVNVYEGKQTVYHFDCYRLENPDEALNAGLDEMMYNGTLCLIEWPEKIGMLLPKNRVEVYLSVPENEAIRNVEINIPDYD